MGCSPRMRCANAWSVDTAAPSRASSAAAARDAAGSWGVEVIRSSSRRMRSRSSAAAFSVNVTATISPIGTPLTVTSAHTRSTSDFVLPEPAPASTNRVASSSSAIATRAAASVPMSSGRVGHSSPSVGASATHTCTSGAAHLRSHSRQRSRMPRESGSA